MILQHISPAKNTILCTLFWWEIRTGVRVVGVCDLLGVYEMCLEDVSAKKHMGAISNFGGVAAYNILYRQDPPLRCP